MNDGQTAGSSDKQALIIDAPLVFCSHASADNDIVLSLAEQLRDNKINVWLDLWNLDKTKDWFWSIDNAIKQAQYAIIFFSTKGLQDHAWYKREIAAINELSIKDKLKLFLVNLDNTELPALFAATPRFRPDTFTEIIELLNSPCPNANNPTPPPLRPLTPDTRLVPDDELAEYKPWALDRYGVLNMIGISAGNLNLSLADAYIPLQFSTRGPDLDPDCPSPNRYQEAQSRQIGELIELETVFTITDKASDLLIFGDPGSGKSTALRKLLYTALTQGPQTLDLPPHTLPVFVRLRRFQSEDLNHSVGDFIQKELNELSYGTFAADFGPRLWKRGHLLLLCDGLDEIADVELRKEFCRYLVNQLTGKRAKNVWCVVAGRYAGYGGEVVFTGNFRAFDVHSLTDGLIKRFVYAWFKAAKRSLKDHTQNLQQIDAAAAAEAQSLLDRLLDPDFATHRIKVIIATPLMLSLLCLVVLRGGSIPESRVEFYTQCLQVLLSKWLEAKGSQPPMNYESIIRILRPVAYRLHAQNRSEDLTQQEFCSIVEPILKRLQHRNQKLPTPDSLMAWLHKDAAVLVQYSENLQSRTSAMQQTSIKKYGFIHRGIQEFLTAQHIGVEGGALINELADAFGPDHWREVVLLLISMPDYKAFTPLLDRLLHRSDIAAHKSFLNELLDQAPSIEPEVFIKALGERRAPTERLELILKLLLNRDVPMISEAVLPLLKHKNKTVARLAEHFCGRKPDKSFIEPVCGLNFLYVPGGRFLMGADDLSYRERPAHWVRVSPFWMSETTVTNEHYEQYLKATGAPEPPFWRDRRFSHPRQPVVAVSWNAAQAFCQWLSQQLEAVVELPTEAQWEFAARSEDNRKYPWGDEEPSTTLANYDESSIGAPEPVGSYPLGKGPFGHLDLAGNVWEWCRDTWDDEEYQKWAAAEPLDPVGTTGDADYHPLRGGSYWDGAEYLRSAFRSRHSLVNWLQDFGFRVVSAPRSLEDLPFVVPAGFPGVQGRSPWSRKIRDWVTKFTKS